MKVIWVDGTNGSDTGTGSKDDPYATIDKAISVFTNKDQIRIKDGTYTPTDSVVISGLEGSIFADNPKGVYIQPAQTRVHAACLAVLDSARFDIHGINILQAADSTGNLIGIYAENVENFVCLTCNVSDFVVPSGDGHGIFAAGDGRIENCVVSNFKCAGANTYGIRTIGMFPIDCEVIGLSGTGDNCICYDVDGLSLG